MKWAALIAWVLTAGGGFVLLSIWLARGGLRQREPGSRIRPPLIFSHFLLAATGLVLWIVYIANDSKTVAWIAFAILAVVAVLGWTMFFIWATQRQRGLAATGSPGATAAAPATTVGEAGPVEQHFPVSIVAAHGLLAVATVLLVLLAAIGVGGS